MAKKMTTREALANAFAPYSKEYQRRAKEASESKKNYLKNNKLDLSDNENSVISHGKFMNAMHTKGKRK